MTAAARAVHLYYADRRALPEGVVEALVTAEDRQRAVPPMHERRRSEYLAARALLRHALAGHTGRDAASFRIEASAGGKPECSGGPAISVSHSGDVLVCALADVGAIGVDVETARPRDHLAAIAERFFTAAEAEWLEAEPVARFHMLWVLKEAHLKALGVGLADGLASLECRIEPPTIVARTAAGEPPRLLLLAGQGCYIAVAAVGVPADVAVVVRRFAPAGSADALGPLRLLATTG